MNDGPPFAIGFGYDTHRLAPARRLVLGGVDIPHDRGLEGHSDADVLLHAVMDALLGAAGLQDIGHFFPNTDERYAGANSRDLLRIVRDEVTSRGWNIGNVDATLVAEAPRIAPHIDAMKHNIASDLQINITRIAIKATTNEKMGFIGRREGIAAMAAALVYRV